MRQPQSIMQRELFQTIIKHKARVILLLVAVTVTLGIFASKIEFDNTIESYFLESDLRDYDRFLEEFGTDEIVVVAFGDDDIFSVDNFELIDTISRKLEGMAHVRRVISLTTAQIVSGKDDSVTFEHLTPALPSTQEDLAAIRERAFADSIIPGTLISLDGRNTAIVAEIEHIIGEFDYKVELLEEIRDLVDDQQSKTAKAFAIGGTAVLDDALMRYTQRDQTLLSPLMMVIVMAVMYLLFRRVTTTLLPLLVVVIAVIWTYGFMSLVGYKINIISTIIGPLLMAVGIADSVHIITDYLQETSRDGRSPIESIERAFHNVIGPCTMTSVTTILGLLSLLTADLVPIRQFGLVAAVGVFAAFVVTILLLPILLALIPAHRVVYVAANDTGVLSRALDWLGRWQRSRTAVIALLCLLAIGPAAYALSQLTIGTNSLDYFRTDDPVRTDTEWIDRRIGGTTSLEFFIEANAGNTLKEPRLLERIEAFQAYLADVPGITKVFSVTDMLKTLNRAFHGGSDDAFVIPDSSAAVAQELLVVEGSADLDALLSSDQTRARITARVAMDKSRDLAHRMPEIEERMHTIFGDATTVTPTGIVYLMHEMEGYLLSSQIKSFLLAFIVITVAMTFALRSLKLGALAMIPNLLPVAFVLALMPALNISLDVGTVMIASVALGLVVDDSIHFLYRLKEQQQKIPDTQQALNRAVHMTARPIIITSIALSLGFAVLVFASFNPVTNFGLLASAVIVLAVVFDLVVLPAMVGCLRSVA